MLLFLHAGAEPSVCKRWFFACRTDGGGRLGEERAESKDGCGTRPAVGIDLGLDMMTKPELVDLAVASLTVNPDPAVSVPASPVKFRRDQTEAELWDDADLRGQGAITRDGRIGKKELGRATGRLHAAAAEEGRSRMDVVAFLCGPPKMSDAMEKTLLKLGLPKQNVRLERWW